MQVHGIADRKKQPHKPCGIDHRFNPFCATAVPDSAFQENRDH
jgi:hypothetical protein